MREGLVCEKWEGLGNDFLVVHDPLPIEAARAAVLLCDRHLGVGADGLLLVGRYPASMRVYNADGSRPEICGNGLRCVVASIAAHQDVDVGTVTVSTDAGDRDCRYRRTAPRSWEVAVDMGLVSFEPADVGFDGGSLDDAVAGRGRVASVGNPHWVFLETPHGVSLASEGRRLETDPRFLRGTNVEFVQRVGPNHWKVDVWERGCGLTRACGSGAVAVAATLVDEGLAAVDEPVRIELPGGSLSIRLRPDGHAWMVGPARRVARLWVESSFLDDDAT
jgi:diaminopimelate epimerase